MPFQVLHNNNCNLLFILHNKHLHLVMPASVYNASALQCLEFVNSATEYCGLKHKWDPLELRREPMDWCSNKDVLKFN